MRFARVVDGRVVETAPLWEGIHAAVDRDTVQDGKTGEYVAPFPMPPDAAATWRRAPDEAQQGWIVGEDGIVAAPPAPVLDGRALRVAAVQQVKDHAARIILAVAPDYRQRNMLARCCEFLRKGEAKLDPAEQQELAAMDAFWTWVKQVRAFSNEQEIPIARADAEELVGYDPATLAWPTL